MRNHALRMMHVMCIKVLQGHISRTQVENFDT